MSFDDFKKAVDSLIDFPNMVGMMGGEPLLHPDFVKFCEYMHSKIPPERCGLWSCFPDGKEHYREIIVKTFGNIFLNDQSRDDILHGPILVASDEVKAEQWEKDYWIDKCWIQKYWSASINPKGAFFCEVAAALALLIDEGEGWPVIPGWWRRMPKEYIDQMAKYCGMCGCAMPLERRPSVDGRDDISPEMLLKLKNKSPKLRQGKYVVHNCETKLDDRPTATYKDQYYRSKIAERYGIFLTLNNKRFQTPHLKTGWTKEQS
jgi:hypothetical protein